MTYPRAHIVTPGQPGFYHCISRCVRQAWLCGREPLSGRDLDYRRAWIEDRLLELAEIFAVAVFSYAVMSNHYHVIVRVDPHLAERWSDEEIARRWVRLYPARRSGKVDEAATEARYQALLAHPDRLAEVRRRLGSLSWFMRRLNEPIARRANREDERQGHFWESRFQCQALLDEAAVLAAMAYVDLNPQRAGMAPSLIESDHTAAQRRLKGAEAEPETLKAPLAPIAGPAPAGVLPCSTREYLALAAWTGEQVHKGNQPKPAGRQPAGPSSVKVLRRVHLNDRQWLWQVQGIGSRYWRMIGLLGNLKIKAQELEQRWLKGIGSARRLALMQT